MASVGTYLNFPGSTEAAFEFYRSVFGGEFIGGIHRFGDMPASAGQPPLADADRQGVMHVTLAILGGHLLMGTDALESMGFKFKLGNHVHIGLAPDSRADADRLFGALSAGGQVEMAMREMFWGDYYGSFKDKFGVQWMVNCSSKA